MVPGSGRTITNSIRVLATARPSLIPAQNRNTRKNRKEGVKSKKYKLIGPRKKKGGGGQAGSVSNRDESRKKKKDREGEEMLIQVGLGGPEAVVNSNWTRRENFAGRGVRCRKRESFRP